MTTELLWKATWIAALIDVPFLLLVARGVTSRLFRSLKWYLAGIAFLMYTGLWGAFASVYFWDSVYAAIFPSWTRWLLPWGYGLLYGIVALAFWWISLRAVRWQAAWFSLCGGLVSLAGHAIGISRGLLRVPLLAEVSPISALIFGIFEFIFYWCAIVCLAVIGRWLVLRRRTMHR